MWNLDSPLINSYEKSSKDTKKRETQRCTVANAQTLTVTLGIGTESAHNTGAVLQTLCRVV